MEASQTPQTVFRKLASGVGQFQLGPPPDGKIQHPGGSPALRRRIFVNSNCVENEIFYFEIPVTEHARKLSGCESHLFGTLTNSLFSAITKTWTFCLHTSFEIACLPKRMPKLHTLKIIPNSYTAPGPKYSEAERHFRTDISSSSICIPGCPNNLTFDSRVQKL